MTFSGSIPLPLPLISVLEENSSKKKLESLKNLSKNPDIIIQNSDKGKSAIILDKKVRNAR